MATFKQKLYFAPLAFLAANAGTITAAGTAAGVGVSAMQGAKANKINEEQAEAAQREQKRHNKEMEKAAREGAAGQSSFSTKTFAALPMSVMRGLVKARQGVQAVGTSGANVLKRTEIGTKALENMKNAGGFAKDLVGTQKNNIKNAAGVAAGIAGTTYLGNRIATSVKDHKEGNDKKNLGFLGKAALTAGTVAGGVWAAKHGKLPGKFGQDFMTTGGGAKAMEGLKKAVNPIVRHDKDVLNAAGKVTAKAGSVDKVGTALKVGMNGAFLAAPTVSYLAQKKAEGDMTEATQKQYAAVPMSVMRGLVKARQGAQNLSGGINKVTSFVGFYGKGGTKAVQNTAKSLQNGSSEWSKGLGNWMVKNPGKANLLAAGGTIAAGSAVGGIGKAMVEKPTRALDKDAYKMEDEANQKVYSAAIKKAVKAGRRHLGKGRQMLTQTVHEVATQPGTFVGRKLGETAESVVKAPITGSLLAVAPIPGSEALTPILGRPEQMLYEKTGISKATKGIRGKIMGPVKKVLKKTGEGVDHIYNGVQSGQILIPGVNM